MLIEQQLASIKAYLKIVWYYNATTDLWEYYDTTPGATSTLTQLIDGREYDIQVTQACTLSYDDDQYHYELKADWNHITWQKKPSPPPPSPTPSQYPIASIVQAGQSSDEVAVGGTVTFTMRVKNIGSVTGRIDCLGAYDLGALNKLTLEATLAPNITQDFIFTVVMPAEGQTPYGYITCVFTAYQWEDEWTPDGQQTLYVVRSAAPPPEYTLSVTISPTGAGTVAKSPDKPTYSQSEVVILAATPSSGYQFSYWEHGTIKYTDNPLSWTVVENTTIIAVFEEVEEPVYAFTISTPTVTVV